MSLKHRPDYEALNKEGSQVSESKVCFFHWERAIVRLPESSFNSYERLEDYLSLSSGPRE
jgi:hypothetical protein